ncbi:MAG: hypothetical protein RI903_217, partial [Bacteroidota bacterium]
DDQINDGPWDSIVDDCCRDDSFHVFIRARGVSYCETREIHF